MAGDYCETVFGWLQGFYLDVATEFEVRPEEAFSWLHASDPAVIEFQDVGRLERGIGSWDVLHDPPGRLRFFEASPELWDEVGVSRLIAVGSYEVDEPRE